VTPQLRASDLPLPGPRRGAPVRCAARVRDLRPARPAGLRRGR